MAFSVGVVLFGIGLVTIALRRDLVIKHANAYSSTAVFIGSDSSPEQWNEIVERSLEGDWIAQRAIDLPRIDIEYWEGGRLHETRCIYNVNPYIYDGKLGGFLNRASTDKLTSFRPGQIAKRPRRVCRRLRTISNAPRICSAVSLPPSRNWISPRRR